MEDRPGVEPDESEPLVQKRYPDSFEETTLESVLTDLAVGRLVVVRAQTDEIVCSTLHGALVRGYDATLVSDAHTTEDLCPGARRHRNSSSRTQISTGAIMKLGRRSFSWLGLCTLVAGGQTL